MTIHNVGYQYRHNSDFCINRPNGSGDCILLIIPTEAYFDLNGQRVYSEPNSYILYRKGTPQHYGAVGRPYINHWIHFDMTDDEAEELTALGLEFDMPVPLGDVTVFAQIIKNMYTEQYSVNLKKNESLMLYLRLLWVKLGERMQSRLAEKSYPYYEKMLRMRTEIYCDPSRKRTVEQLAAKMMLSVSYFHHLYKQIFGVSVMADIITARIEHGKYLLEKTDDSVAAIALHCGYENDAYFMRLFKLNVGITPTQYRRRFRVSHVEVEKGKQRQPHRIKV